MSQTAPHYLLLCETNDYENESGRGGRWSFVLEKLGSGQRIDAAEDEPHVVGERLQLLAVVRGLEALEQPSNVTLVTSSAYVGRGIRQNLRTWRENGFQWERFGLMKPIKNRDLWRRVDRAMNFHTVECRIWSFDRISMPKTTNHENNRKIVLNTVSSRWETTCEDPPVIGDQGEGLSKLSDQVSDRFRTVGFRRSYGHAAS